MKFSRYLRFVPIFTICCSVVASPQAGNPVTALEELVTAENATDAARHYPFSVQQAIEGLTEEEKTEAAKVLVISQKLRERGYELHRTTGRLCGCCKDCRDPSKLPFRPSVTSARSLGAPF